MLELRNIKPCDCCKVSLPVYEMFGFDLLDENGFKIKAVSGHEKCVEHEARKYPIKGY